MAGTLHFYKNSDNKYDHYQTLLEAFSIGTAGASQMLQKHLNLTEANRYIPWQCVSAS